MTALRGSCDRQCGPPKGLFPAAAVAALWLSLAPACSKSHPSHQGSPSAPRDLARTAAPAALTAPTGRWLVREIQVELQLDDSQRVAGADTVAVSAAVQQGLRGAATIAGVGEQPGFALSDQAGLLLRIAWQRLDDRGQPQPLQHPGDGQLLLLVVAHAERAGAQPHQNEVAERTKRSLLPVPAGQADWPGWLLPRVQRAAEAAAVEVLGELWARGAANADLISALQATAQLQLLAAAREIGERRLTAQRADLERLARDSRRDVAAIAIAALGRLGGMESIAVLRRLVDHGPPEVVDAALVALASLKEPRATAALAEIAEQADAEVASRARELLKHPHPIAPPAPATHH